MIARIRLLVTLARPALVLLLALCAATGLAEAGRPDDLALLAPVMVVVASFVLFSALVNDLADERIDRVNLAGVPARGLVTGACTRRQYMVAAPVAAAVALSAGAFIGWRALVVVAGGLAFSAAYSLRPVRVADRGAAASLLLPAGYVAVPYLVGVLAVHAAIRPGDLVLLAGLYVGFIGRILLKDFRDVRGDTLFGKRTFLVRHGRRATCRFSAVCWVLGSAILAAREANVGVAVAVGGLLVASLCTLGALSRDRGARRDEWLVAAAAIVGRGAVLTVLVHLGVQGARWSAPAQAVFVVALAACFVGQAVVMARRGPTAGLRTVPSSWTAGAATIVPVAAHAQSDATGVGSRSARSTAPAADVLR